MRIIFLTMAAVCLLINIPIVHAENKGKIESADELIAGNDAELRKKLIRKLHRILPTSKIVDKSIDSVAPRYAKNAKELDQFQKSMRYVVDYNSLDSKSNEFMDEVFTTEELQALSDFYTNEHGLSAASKMSEYQIKIGTEVMKEIDKSLLRYRTGGESDIK